MVTTAKSEVKVRKHDLSLSKRGSKGFVNCGVVLVHRKLGGVEMRVKPYLRDETRLFDLRMRSANSRAIFARIVDEIPGSMAPSSCKSRDVNP